jgi:hypothetical protein
LNEMKLICRLVSLRLALLPPGAPLFGWTARHAARCGHCGRESAAYARLGAALRQQPAEVSRLTAADLKLAIQRSAPAKTGQRRMPIFALTASGAVAAILVAAVLALHGGAGRQAAPIVARRLPRATKAPTVKVQPLPAPVPEQTVAVVTPPAPVVSPDQHVLRPIRQASDRRTAPVHHRPAWRPTRRAAPRQPNIPAPRQNDLVVENNPKPMEAPPAVAVVAPEERVITVVGAGDRQQNNESYTIRLVGSDESPEGTPF